MTDAARSAPAPRPPAAPHPAPAPPPRTLRAGWAEAWSSRGFRIELALTIVAAVVGLTVFSNFLAWVEERPGVELADPVLAMFPSRDVGDATFVAIYGGILVALFVLLRRPRLLVATLQSYLLLIALRAFLMWLTPLDSPEHLIVLRDPIVNSAVPGPPLKRDLFFSGHTSTLVLLTLWMPGPRARGLLLACALTCAVLLLVQHAHYTVDVAVAPMAAWTAYSIVRRVKRSSRITRL